MYAQSFFLQPLPLLLIPLIFFFFFLLHFPAIHALAISNSSALYLAQNAVLIRSSSLYNYLQVSINGLPHNLLLDLNSPILWSHDNTTTPDNKSANFSLRYNEDHQINGKYSAANNLTIANISLHNQYIGSVTSSSDLQSFFNGDDDTSDDRNNGNDGNKAPLDGVFGLSYFNPVLTSLNSTAIPKTLLNSSSSSHVSSNSTPNTTIKHYENKLFLSIFNERDNIQLNGNQLNTSESRGLMVFGEIDEDLISDNVYFTSVLASSDYYWLIGISSVKRFSNNETNTNATSTSASASASAISQITFKDSLALDDGGTIQNSSRAAIFDLSVSYINNNNAQEDILLITSFDDAETIHNELFGYNGYEFDNLAKEFILNCQPQQLSETLVLEIGANLWNITSDDYIGSPVSSDDNGSNSKCYSNIKTYDNQNLDFNQSFVNVYYNWPKLATSQYWILGAKFAQNLNLIFDYDAKLVGLSLRHSSSSSSSSSKPTNIITDTTLLQQIAKENNYNENSDYENESESGDDSDGNISTISSVFTESVRLSYGTGYGATTTVVQSLIIFGTLESSFSFDTGDGDSSSASENLAAAIGMGRSGSLNYLFGIWWGGWMLMGFAVTVGILV